MNMPENGRVVVIDNEESEAIPLLKVLFINGIAAAFFTGMQSELPRKPLEGIRVVFLDLELVYSNKKKTIKATLQKVLGKIISKNNGPYILIFWSVHESDYTKALQELFDDQLSCIKPAVVLSLEKLVYMKTNKAGQKEFVSTALKLIDKKLRDELKKAGAFDLFVLWENIVHKSAGKIVNDFSSFYPLDENWNKNMFRVFRALAEAYAGERLQPGNINEISKNSLLTFNIAFLDNLESVIENFQYAGRITGLRPRGRPDADIISKINSRLLVAEAGDDNSIKPGNLYEGGINKRRHAAIQDVYNGKLSQFSQTQRDNLIASVKNVFLEVSPLCDYTCNKLRAYRFLPGLMWPSDFSKQIKKSAEYLYVSPLVNIKNNKYKLVFDIRCLTTLPVNTPRSNKKLLGRIRHELLVDIQSYIARHVSRPGVTSVNWVE